MKTLIAAVLMIVSTSSFATTCTQYQNMKTGDALQLVKDTVHKASKGKKTDIDKFTDEQLLITGAVLFCNK